MYRVIKEAGNHANITVENTDTLASISIGTITPRILDILDINGYKDKCGATSDEWIIEINKDTAQKLVDTTMSMARPIRKKQENIIKKTNKEIDAMDVILGLANYN